jgi:hypothetical protein
MLTFLLLAASLAVLGNLVVPDASEVYVLDAWTGKAAASAWTLRLFANNHTPVAGDAVAQYTEAAGGGYAAILLTAASWTTTAGGTAPETTTAYAAQTFTFTGPLTTNLTVYGYYLTRASDGALILAELLASPFTPANNGDSIVLTLSITMASVFGD